jgi:hypothetical protein
MRFSDLKIGIPALTITTESPGIEYCVIRLNETDVIDYLLMVNSPCIGLSNVKTLDEFLDKGIVQMLDWFEAERTLECVASLTHTDTVCTCDFRGANAWLGCRCGVVTWEALKSKVLLELLNACGKNYKDSIRRATISEHNRERKYT